MTKRLHTMVVSELGHLLINQVDPSKTDGVTADNVTAPLVKILAPNSFTMHKEDFVASLNSEAELNFTPPGEKVKDIHMDLLLALQSDALIVAPHRDPSNPIQSHPLIAQKHVCHIYYVI